MTSLFYVDAVAVGPWHSLLSVDSGGQLLSHLGSGYEARYSAALFSAWDVVDAEGSACLLSASLCLHTVGNVGGSSRPSPELGCP